LGKVKKVGLFINFGGGATTKVYPRGGFFLPNNIWEYGTFQKWRTVNKDYLKTGYWPKTGNKEFPAKGLSFTFLNHLEDETKGEETE